MQFHRINQVLNMWECLCLEGKIGIKRYMMAGSRTARLEGVFAHSESFRADILARKPFDPDKYVGSKIIGDALGSFTFLPPAIHAWATESRRIYHLPSDIQRLIQQTDVGDLTWRDVSLPFSAFAITLTEPVTEPGMQEFDCLLVYQGIIYPLGIDGIMIWALSKEFERPLGVDQQKLKRAFEKLVFRNNAGPALKLSDQISSLEAAQTTAYGANIRVCTIAGDWYDRPIKETFHFVKEHKGEIIPGSPLAPREVLPMSQWMIDVQRLAEGLCLYLDTHRSSCTRRATSTWKPVEIPTPDPLSVTNEAEVCQVQSVYIISELERRLLAIIDPIERNRQCRELGVKYREGHWRKRPFYGRDPSAPKCVHVRPCIVGLRRLGPSGLPPGVAKVL
jgi:hypothetical protein